MPFARPVRADLLRIVRSLIYNLSQLPCQDLCGDTIQLMLFERQRFGLVNRVGHRRRPLPHDCIRCQQTRPKLMYWSLVRLHLVSHISFSL